MGMRRRRTKLLSCILHPVQRIGDDLWSIGICVWEWVAWAAIVGGLQASFGNLCDRARCRSSPPDEQDSGQAEDHHAGASQEQRGGDEVVEAPFLVPRPGWRRGRAGGRTGRLCRRRGRRYRSLLGWRRRGWRRPSRWRSNRRRLGELGRWWSRGSRRLLQRCWWCRDHLGRGRRGDARRLLGKHRHGCRSRRWRSRSGFASSRSSISSSTRRSRTHRR